MTDAQGAAAGVTWRARAEAVIPAGASTGSKRAAALHGPHGDADAPTHFVRAHGCRVTAPDGRTFVDLAMALGAVALGYADADVVRRVSDAAAAGNVAGLSSVHEVELAERLCATIPCAERALFLKSGAEGVSAAVRLARTVTGRDHVIGAGYFGWHDWWSDAAGVPAGVRADFTSVPFDDVHALASAVDANVGRLAAVVLEPIVEREASYAWLSRARALCDRAGAVLVFDEVKTGFRVHRGGHHALSRVMPDLAVFSKAMANGFPLAAVVGRRDVMEAARRTWISSTLSSEAAALCAALAVLDRHDAGDVCGELAAAGRRLRDAVARATHGTPGVALVGIDPMWFLRFDDERQEARFLAAARGEGVLFKRGAYCFASLAHDDAAVAAVARAAEAGVHALHAASA